MSSVHRVHGSHPMHRPIQTPAMGRFDPPLNYTEIIHFYHTIASYLGQKSKFQISNAARSCYTVINDSC